MGETRNACKLLVGKPQGNRPFGRPRRRCEDNLGMDHTEIGWKYVEWTHVAQDRNQWLVFVNMIMNGRVP
jgi:hypothetical protein